MKLGLDVAGGRVVIGVVTCHKRAQRLEGEAARRERRRRDERMRVAREVYGWTDDELGEMLGMHPSSVRRIFAGRTR